MKLSMIIWVDFKMYLYLLMSRFCKKELVILTNILLKNVGLV